MVGAEIEFVRYIHPRGHLELLPHLSRTVHQIMVRVILLEEIHTQFRGSEFIRGPQNR